ncbi:hypothetical protein HanIR_Chr08g0356611 [Helianthus annuus]|nr:hypothetical protein HanIR_Chr08g0356611 [Helianthus annuus]KAJ0552850.1 hypothetical protein HanHA89_Chr08g0289761 [Helianthus annuus]KAJ0718532.1 hypothetical protein HanLR1_Chr08g0271631 [Helianthus annuus]
MVIFIFIYCNVEYGEGLNEDLSLFSLVTARRQEHPSIFIRNSLTPLFDSDNFPFITIRLTLNKLGGSLKRNGSNGSWMRRMFARTRGK